MPDRVDVFVIGSFIVAVSTEVARFPAPGESLSASNLTLEPGGKGFNLALGLHRLGVPVNGIMAVGVDIFASFAAEALKRAGLPLSMLRHLEGQTGTGLGLLTEGGDNCLAIYPGANALLSASDVLAHEALKGASFVLAQFETSDDAILAGFHAARAEGAQTLLNPSPYRRIDPQILANSSVLIVNETEAALCGRDLGTSANDHAGLAAGLFEQGVGMLIVTLGASGVTAYRKGEAAIHRPAYRVAAIDPLGAGDAFTAGFVSGLVNGADLAESLDRGAACGAFCVARRGVYDALPHARDLGP